MEPTQDKAEGRRLGEALKRRGLTQAEVFRQTGIDQGTVSKMVNGDMPLDKHRKALARLLRVSQDWLSDGKGPDPFADQADQLSAVILAPTTMHEGADLDAILRERDAVISRLEKRVGELEGQLARAEARAEARARERAIRSAPSPTPTGGG